jgi:pimeloyl-ACP methyl ester carboxylesterase
MPDQVIEYPQFVGSYRGGERQILVIAGRQRLTYLEPVTGAYRVLSPLGKDVFASGTGFKLTEPVESLLSFERGADGIITQVHWQHGSVCHVLAREPAFEYENVTFQNEAVTLSGWLVKPTALPPFPAIVMLHGSGPQDRYEFQPIAEYFASLGFAVFVYDKRGVGQSGGDWRNTSYDVLASDALCGIRYLQSRADIDSHRIGLWGISQGGWLTLLVASLLAAVSFIIPVSAPGVPPVEQEVWRVEHMLRSDGYPDSAVDRAVALSKRYLSLWQADDAEWDTFRHDLNGVKDEPWHKYLGIQLSTAKADLFQDTTWHFEPTLVLKQVTCPVLAIFGELDPYLPVAKSVRLFESILYGQKSQHHVVHVVSKGNHSMFRAITGGDAEKSTLPGFVPEYLSIMRDWLKERLKNRID